MRIYLVRHGKASKDATKYPTDEERALTKRGRADADRIAALVAKSGAVIHQIRHSGIRRAQETADIFAKHLNPPGGVIAVKGLLWDDPVETLARELPLEPDPVMLVGHNPFMENLVSVLLTGSVRNVPPVAFRTSGTVCLEYLEGQWSVCWSLCPEIVPGDKEE